MSDQGDQGVLGWLSIAEAADAYGVAEKTIRRRIHAGRLPAQQVEGRNGPEWRVARPDGAPAGRVYPTQDIGRYPTQDIDQGVQGTSDAPQEPAEWPRSGGSQPAAMIPLDQLERLLAPLAQERDRLVEELARERERHRAELAELQERRLEDARAAAEELGRLRGLLEGISTPAETSAAPAAVQGNDSSSPPAAASQQPRRRRRIRWPWGH